MWYHPAHPHKFYHAEAPDQPTDAGSLPTQFPSRHGAFPAPILKYKYSGSRSWWDLEIINLTNSKTVQTQIKPDDLFDVFHRSHIQTKHFENDNFQYNFDSVLKVTTDFINKHLIRLEWKFEPDTERYKPHSITGDTHLFDNSLRSACGLPSIEAEEELKERKEEYRKYIDAYLYAQS